MEPFAKLWVDLAIDYGITMEAHAQNIMIGISESGDPIPRFLFRDLGGFNMDISFLRTKFPNLPQLPIGSSEKKTYKDHRHTTSLIDSLYTYFSAGFLWDLDQRLPKWVEKGYLRERMVGETEVLLKNETEKAIEKKSGLRVKLYSNYHNLPAIIRRARSISPSCRTFFEN